MSSSDEASISSRRTSLAQSSVSSYQSQPSLSAQQRSAIGDCMPAPPSAKGSQGYVSPYPPLPSATNPNSTIPDARSTQHRAQPFTSAASGSTSLEEEEPTQKQALIEALNEHRFNTIGELRRVERIFATLGSPDLTQPMTAAWMYYVNSNSLLTEIRTLTRNYPFSSECLDEAKRRVYEDPASNRSWNLCWLILAKLHTDRLIPTYAMAQAQRPEMWGGRGPPDGESVQRLANAFVTEWNGALAQFLRFWEAPPIQPRE